MAEKRKSGCNTCMKGIWTSNECSPEWAEGSSCSLGHSARKFLLISASMETAPKGVRHRPPGESASVAPLPVWFGPNRIIRLGRFTEEKTLPATEPEYTYPA